MGKGLLQPLLNTVEGDYGDREIIHKFGHNDAVSTDYVPIASGGVYRTPQVSGATALRIKAGDANDTADGSGAREITLECLSITGTVSQAVLTTAGLSASDPTSDTAIRVFRAWVSKSGTYASASQGSHAAAIVIENAAGSEDWLTIGIDGFPRSQSGVGAYTVPLGKTAYILSASIGIDTTKTSDLLLFKRESILDTQPPYQAMRVVQDFSGLIRTGGLDIKSPLGPFPELTDLGFLGKIDAGTAEIDVDFEILLITNES